ncbi:phenylalanine--tRNA ligase subunit beta [Ralstonia insidiosa]|jgi:phenylalanyl-tRNA synthetase beta chain|uniref:phenylalanine--tRNA ligase subunit beta n=1 Tax=Ralstonia TaxID=48736 RepID=UPI0006649F8B|nr:phenylalanine--tRNA ligase subunit beta [Ralstonia insidiosa]KMW47955.1 phenylalanyl-tRNA synthetase subunit beta [Ralstonia sp. MD27]MBX3770477.1 phenylalanine--tRNA ligase subunit beta [Ralstonia pickettii]NOZ14668.1 phenylalanine--tRNA ligase subunit beta [Betaproteobacteria bacterium]MBA9854639.1 phenylalanine--tRNA ligase subunit beta [Ralstonia insidiosa]MBA9868454.1 phenylalanine--tRNA ligase subunit beta [Ralstonia insidiosa]
MQFPESWLRSFVNPSITTDELSHRLTMAGLEVEEVDPVAPPFTNIVVGHVVEVNKHPDADRLNVCKVDAGTGELLQIVCGAPNVSVGIKVPCAMVGAELPPGEDGKPFKIKIGKLRGVESYGMLCSARELKLSEDHGGLLILPEDTPVGADIRKVLDLDDQIFVIKLTPNKADCLSIHGVAREVSALTGAPITVPSMAPVAVTLSDKLPVKVEAPDLCGRFSGRIIRGVNAHAKTPAWMVSRIERAGMRSVSALVDISNYVMLELGRPSHVFDLDKIHGGLTVRWGKAGEQLKLLNGDTITVDEKVGVISDEQAIESLAGIMGGDKTAVTLDTQNIYVEAAFWWPEAIQGRGRRYNFSTDAGHRFERGVDYATTVEHIERISALILEICGGQAGPIDDQIVNLPKREPVRMRVARAARVLGIPLSHEVVADVFKRLGLTFNVDGDVFIVEPPSYRFDIEIEEDLIEEVARIYGFEQIPAKPPVAENAMRPTSEARRTMHDVRHAVAARDYHEVVNFAFVETEWEADFAGNTNPIPLLNPIASQYSVMRSTLIGGLLDKVRYNLNRKASRVRMFEVGRVFHRDASVADGGLSIAGYAQPMMVGGIAYGPSKEEQWGVQTRPVDFFDVKGDVESLLWPLQARFERAEHPALHPGRSARVVLNGRAIGWIGELHPRWLQKYDLPTAPVVWELELDAITAVGLPKYREVPRVPAVTRDIALVVRQDVAVQDLVDTFEKTAVGTPWQRYLQGVVLFDEFRPKAATAAIGAQEKSLAFRITLQDTDSTLQDDIVEAATQQLIRAAGDAFGARLRA